MIATNFQGYIEGADVTRIPVQNLAYPSKNVIVSKGKITTRGGLVNDGVAATVSEAIHSEFVWKDALGGVRPIRCHGQSVQVKYNNKWYTIYESLDSDTVRVFFATWVDNNDSIIRKRLFFVDGSTAIYQWNGAIAEVESYDSDVITLDIEGTALQEGFDDGTGTSQSVRVFSLDGDGAVDDTSDYVYNNDASGDTLSLTTTPDPVPVAGDVVIAGVKKFADEVSSAFDLDFIYSFQNHVVVGNYNSVNLYFSHIETYDHGTGLDFTMPAAGSRTALTPIFFQLDGNITALISRKNVLWVSDKDDWYKVTKTIEVNAYGLWVDVEKFETGENKGALPMAVTKYKGDLIYVAQDKTMQRISTVEVLGTDEIRQISDDVEDLLDRVDMDDVRIYYLERAIYLICPQDSTMIILDLVEGYFQPPQIMPINCMSVISGVKYGHHNTENQTYTLFSGRDDLGTDIEAVIAFGYQAGDHQFKYKKHTMFGVSCRMTVDTIVSVDTYFEENGAKTLQSIEIDGSVVKKFTTDDDVSWATHPYAERSIGGADMVVQDLARVTVFDKNSAIAYFDFRPVFTISGSKNEFHLLAWYIDQKKSERKVGNDLFIEK
jgi:hypothetical protein